MSAVDTAGTEQDDELAINEVYLRCLNSFVSCRRCSHLSPASRQLVDDEMSRFKIWGVNIRAHLVPSVSLSLDHRLRNSERTKASVITLLRVLRVNIDYATRIFEESEDTLYGIEPQVDQEIQEPLSGDKVERSIENDKTRQAVTSMEIAMKLVDEALSSIHAMISQLKRISNAIKRASVAEYDLHAARNRDLEPNSDQGADYEALQLKVRYMFKEEPDPLPDSLIKTQEALLNAVEFRMRRFKDWKKYHEKLLNWEKRKISTEPLITDQPCLFGNEPGAGHAHSPDSNAAHITEDKPSKKPIGVESTVLSQPSFDSKLFEKPKSISQSTSISLSVRSMMDGTYVDWPCPPKIPHESSDDDGVECPYCFDRLDRGDVISKTKWRKHVKRDLEPYNCLNQECQHYLKMFASEEQWTRHIRAYHSQGTWICRLKPHKKAEWFNDEATVREHLENQHKGLYPKSRIETLIRSMHRPGDGSLFAECPMNCLNQPSASEGDDLTHHVAHHLLSLAMAALPERSVASSQSRRLEDDEDPSGNKSDVDTNATVKKDINDLPIVDFESRVTIEGINEQRIGLELGKALDSRPNISSWLESLSEDEDSTKSHSVSIPDIGKAETHLLPDHDRPSSGGPEMEVERLPSTTATFNAESEAPERALFHASSMDGQDRIVESLLRAGVDVNATNEDGETALFHASKNGRISAIRLLISKGADINAMSESHETPLIYAARNGHEEAAMLLIQSGADGKVRGVPGRLEYAIIDRLLGDYEIRREWLLGAKSKPHMKDR